MHRLLDVRLAALALAAAQGQGRKKCVKGIQCCNVCIAVSETFRIGYHRQPSTTNEWKGGRGVVQTWTHATTACECRKPPGSPRPKNRG